MMTTEKYINPYTDFGFKKLFGTEMNKAMFDKWMFVLRNLSRLLDRPKALQDRIFTKLFEQAEIAKYSVEERREYEASVKNYWDYYSTMTTAVDKEKKKIALNLKKMGLSDEDISKATGLTIGEICNLN